MKPKRLLETTFMNTLLVELNKLPRTRAWRANSGVVETRGGSRVKLGGAGTPDIAGVTWPSVAFYVECKVAPSVLTDVQAKRIELWRTELGAVVVVATAHAYATAEEAARHWCERVAFEIEQHRAFLREGYGGGT